VSIEGTPPDLLIPVTHCSFAPRCPYAFDRCWKEIPPLIPLGPRHHASCFYDINQGGPRNV
jgi:oligopeptide transport system ATP-binding protein